MAKKVFSFRRGINIKPVTTLPANAETGDVSYLLNENVFKYYDGSQWLDFAPTTITNIVAGENIPARTPVYISPGATDGGRNPGQVYICSDGSNTIRRRMIGVTRTAVTSGGTVTVVCKGELFGFSSLPLGSFAFWDGTSMQFTEPTLSQNWVRVGVVKSSSSIIVDQLAGVRMPNSSDVVTLDAPQTLSNKNLSGTNNTFSNIPLSSLAQDPGNPDRVIRRDGSGNVITGNQIPNNSPIVTTDATQTLTNKSYENARLTQQVYHEVQVNSTLTGANATLFPDASVVILTNSGLTSIEAISEVSMTSPITGSGRLTVINRTGNVLIFRNNSGAVVTRRIINGNGDDIEIENEDSISFLYDTNASRWKVAGGGAGGGSVTIRRTAGENLAQYTPVYVSKGNANGDAGRTAGQLYTLDPSNDHRMEYIGIVKASVTAGNDVAVQLSGRVNIPASMIQGGAFINGEMVYWNGTQFTTTQPTNTNFWLIKVGKAFSNTGMVVNPDLGASAIYVPATPNVLTINNNVTSPTNIGLSFNPSTVSAFKIHYQVTRVAGSTEIVESGLISGHYNSALGQWTLVNYGISSDAGVDFSMIGNDVAYTSSNMTGSPYSGSFRYRIETEINPGLDFNATVANNVTSPTNVTGMFMQPSSRAMSIFYMVRRTAGSTEIAEAGIINLVRNVTASICDISVSGISGDADVFFDVTSGGQVRYTSGNMTGSPYSGNIWWEVLSEL